MSASTPPRTDGDASKSNPRQVEALTADMHGMWVVESQHSRHVWNLDAMTYTRIPGPGSPVGHFVLDMRPLPISRVDRWPSVGSTSLVWFDDPSDPQAIEHWRRSSRIVTITEMGGHG